MKPYALKPFDDGKYLSVEAALEELAGLPDPVEKGSVKKNSEPAVPATGNFPKGENSAADLEGRLIDLNPADDGSNKTQDEWIDYFNGRNEVIVSMPDIYRAGKSGNRALLDSLRKDFEERWIVTSTRVKYENNQDARIIHNYGSRLVQPVEHKVVIPEYRPQPLKAVLNTKEGLRYLQALLGTNDNAKEIKDTLHKLSNYTTSKTNIWSVALSDRPAERASGFDYYGGGFRVYGYDFLDYDGRSRGVRIGAASAPQKNLGA